MPVLGSKKRKKSAQAAYDETRDVRGVRGASDGTNAAANAKERMATLGLENQRMRKKIRELRQFVKFAETQLFENKQSWKKQKQHFRDQVYQMRRDAKLVVESMEAGDSAYEEDDESDDDDGSDDDDEMDDDSAFEESDGGDDDEEAPRKPVRKKPVRKKPGHYKKKESGARSKAAVDKFTDRKLAVLLASIKEQFGEDALDAWLLDSEGDGELQSSAVALSKVLGRIVKRFPRLWLDLVRHSRHTGRDDRFRTASPVSQKIDPGSHSEDRGSQRIFFERISHRTKS